MSVQSGDTLGHYRILEPLGKGGMGEVFAAEDTKLHRKVALKVLPAILAGDPERRLRFEREAQAVAALNHPGIVTIHSVEADGAVPFLTMELVEGQLLRDAIPKGGSAVDVLLKTAIGVTDAVAAAHQRGIVHRDLKPANVIVCPDGRVKVLDFGLAKLHEAQAAAAAEASTQMLHEDLTGEGRIVGTVAYMSPEQAEGKPVDTRSDIFSLGVMLHEMATGERPFRGDSEISIISSIIKDTPPAVTDSRPDLPAPLTRIVRRCLAKDPLKRYQSTRDLHNDLEDLKQDVDSGVTSGVGVAALPAAAGRGVSRRVATVLIAALVIVAALAAVAWWAARRQTAAAEFVADRFVRLTNSGTVSVAAISPDGRYVVHAKLENQLPSLWVRLTGSTSDVRIVPPANARFGGVAFSPDGSFVYYNAYAAGSGVATLYKVPVLGGAPMRLIDDVDSPVTFSPDGTRLAFMRGYPAENKRGLMIAGIDGGNVRELVATTGDTGFDNDMAPWAPDGTRLLATGHVNEHNVIFARLMAVDAATGQVTQFGGDWFYIHGGGWMPDGRSVLVSARDRESTPSVQIWQVSWPGGERRRVTSGVNGYEAISMSADGRTIAAIEAEQHWNIWVYPMSGGSGRALTSFPRGAPGGSGLAWTPDGRIVYGAEAGESGNQLFIMDGDGGHVTQLTTLKSFAALPSVTSDGQWIYFNGGADLVYVWRLPPGGGEPAQLTQGPRDYRPLVSTDGQWVYYTSDFDGRPRAMKLAASGGTPVALTPPELRFNATSVSPDGTSLYGFAWNRAARRSQAARVSTHDGAATFLPGAPPRGMAAPDGRHWLYTDVQNSVAGIFLRPIEGGAERRIVDLNDEQALRTVVSPDGQRLAVMRGRSTADVVLIKAK